MTSSIFDARCLMFLVLLVGILGGCATGCSYRPIPQSSDRRVIFVPGVAGDGAWYDSIYNVCREQGITIQPWSWGAPKLFFFANFSDPRIHDQAEQKLARYLEQLPQGVHRIDLIGHSAGCGVILGAVARSTRPVHTLILLAPSVSPGYDLNPTLNHVQNRIYSFYSEKDVTFLNWRTSYFGTYDGIKTPAAGHQGFKTTSERLVQFPYDPAWVELGHDGSHFGSLAKAFVRQKVIPLLLGSDDSESSSKNLHQQ